MMNNKQMLLAREKYRLNVSQTKIYKSLETWKTCEELADIVELGYCRTNQYLLQMTRKGILIREFDPTKKRKRTFRYKIATKKDGKKKESDKKRKKH